MLFAGRVHLKATVEEVSGSCELHINQFFLRMAEKCIRIGSEKVSIQSRSFTCYVSAPVFFSWAIANEIK